MSSNILRQATRSTFARRAFATSSVARKDLVQDLYIKELRAFKVKPQAKDAHVGVVKAYSTPSAPKAPTLPTDLSAELSAYDASNPTVDTQKAEVKSEFAEQEGGQTPEAFLEFLEKDLPKVEHHH
ncbi:ATP synthase complex subunit H-domain-containing protein [Pterulicium gracile]|uniref:ATP synthase complex subunit H-domain-containing protein n=1 Tax=Pterulicium gracile TaxID=1884261 RepID=A0A5C3Q791_9AGAR|nr:ATP synthase complex subunit H-domain-containing protein [Pterula gracilis]